MLENHNNTVDLLTELEEKRKFAMEEELKILEEAVNIVFKSAAGKILGKWLYKNCNLGKENNDINPNKLVYFKSREDLYHSLKGLMSKESIINIELGGF